MVVLSLRSHLTVSKRLIISGGSRTERSVSDTVGKINRAIDKFVGNVTTTTGTPSNTNDIDTEFWLRNQAVLQRYDDGQITKDRLNLELNMNRYEYQQARNDRLTGRTGN